MKKLVSRLNLSVLLLALLLFVIALVPRILEIGGYLTVDESLWHIRSLNFWDALLDGNFGGTYQMTHPNVITMWIVGFTFKVANKIGFDVYNGVDWIMLGRFAVGVLTAFGCVILFYLLNQVLRVGQSFIICTIIALDPFVLAYTRVVHVHAVSATFIMLSFVALLVAFSKEKQWPWIAFSGMLGGLALLTNVNAVMLVGAVVLTILFQPNDFLALFDRAKKAFGFKWFPRLKMAGLWLLLLVITFYVGWPAMWTQPRYTISRLVTGVMWGVNTPHGGDVTDEEVEALYSNNPDVIAKLEEYRKYQVFDSPRQFFRGELVYTPGPSFYPLTWLYRTTPLTLIFVLMAFGWLLVDLFRKRLDEWDGRVIYLLVFALGFMLVMGMAAKQIQRYLLPSFLFLDIVAGYYLVRTLDWSRDKFKSIKLSPESFTYAAGGLLVVLFHLLPFVRSFPYMVAYYEPLLGGTDAAKEIFLLGDGEGLSLAAEYLNDTYGNEISAATRYAEYFAPFFDGETVYISPIETYDLEQADFLVYYVREEQRRESPELDAYLSAHAPEKTISLNGTAHVWVYNLSGISPLAE